jgi:hypothetical protein
MDINLKRRIERRGFSYYYRNPSRDLIAQEDPSSPPSAP